VIEKVLGAMGLSADATDPPIETVFVTFSVTKGVPTALPLIRSERPGA